MSELISLYTKLCLERLAVLEDMLVNYPLTVASVSQMVDEAIDAKSKAELIKVLTWLNGAIDAMKGDLS